jgi:hypothetical protein
MTDQVPTEPLTNDMIATLRSAAAAASDTEMVKACDDANHYHSGRRAHARHDCAAAITAARAMDNSQPFVRVTA